jgi:hypothetical protein
MRRSPALRSWPDANMKPGRPIGSWMLSKLVRLYASVRVYLIQLSLGAISAHIGTSIER